MNSIERLRADLRDLERRGLLRSRQSPYLEGLIDVASNDYLGYAAAPVSRETTVSIGAGASRLVGGTHSAHEALEAELAAWVDLPGTLLFSSGYAANVGVLGALGGPGRVLISDELNHASIIDGCRLSRGRVVVVPHRDLRAVENALGELSPNESAWVVTESYFSMDADTPDLRGLRAACDRTNSALYVDEAHALGVFGTKGGGLCTAHGVRPDILIGTFGKALGAQGAFVAADHDVLEFLWNRARSFVFSTGVSPRLAALVQRRLQRCRDDDIGRRKLERLSASLERSLGNAAAEGRHGPVFPVLFGTEQRAAAAVAALRAAGFFAVAIRPPTVPVGTARVRISLHADLADDDVARLAEALRQCLES